MALHHAMLLCSRLFVDGQKFSLSIYICVYREMRVVLPLRCLTTPASSPLLGGGGSIQLTPHKLSAELQNLPGAKGASAWPSKSSPLEKPGQNQQTRSSLAGVSLGFRPGLLDLTGIC